MVPLAATEQSGVFTREQALAEGWTPSQVEHRLRTGAWRRLAGRALIRGDVTPSAWSGVWAVHLTRLTAVASHLTAAAAHRMPVPAGPVHATAGLRLRSLKDLVVHRVPLPAVQVLRVGAHGPLLTTPLRSAMDCLRILPEDDAVRLLGWCLTRGVLTREDLVAEVGEAAGRHGNRALLALLRRTVGGALSEAERLFHTTCGGPASPAGRRTPRSASTGWSSRSSTSSSTSLASPWRSTVGARTPIASPSSGTGVGRTRSSTPATSSCGSPGVTSRTVPTTSPS